MQNGSEYNSNGYKDPFSTDTTMNVPQTSFEGNETNIINPTKNSSIQADIASQQNNQANSQFHQNSSENFYSQPTQNANTPPTNKSFISLVLDNYREFWERIVDFSGITSPVSFWTVILANVVIFMLINVFQLFDFSDLIASLLSSTFSLAIFIPYLAIQTRRLRDAGFNPLLMLLHLVPCLGSLVILILCAFPSKVNVNNCNS